MINIGQNYQEVVYDDLADIVIQRAREALDWRQSHEVYQEQTAEQLILSADRQMTRTYSTEAKHVIQELFGYAGNVVKYDSITQEKVEAVTDWYSDMFVASLDKVFTVKPSPEPTLDNGTVRRIQQGVLQELWQRMQEIGVSDPSLLIDAFGAPIPQVQEFVTAQVKALKKVEQNRLMAIAQDACEQVALKMRDIIVEGNFRRAFSEFTHDRFLYGVAVMRFPEWKRVRRLKHEGGKAKPVFELVPTFRRVQLYDFFPSPDATLDLQECLGVTERRAISKVELIGLLENKDYRKKQIEEVIEEFSNRSRGWLPQELEVEHQGDTRWWGPDETITLLVHEGFFTGEDLKDAGINNVKDTDYVSARVEICGGRTIRAQLLNAKEAPERSYFAAPFSVVGDSFWDCVGIAAKVADIEARVNFVLHTMIENLDWSARPPILVTPNVFKDPSEADVVAPGNKYQISDMAVAANGNIPDPLRPMAPVSAQYTVLLGTIMNLRRMADDASGVPAYAYGGANYGQASLGEFAQRMANALRVVKGAARKEDMYFTEPAFSVLFRHLVEKNEELVEGQDLQCQVRGMAGLLEDSAKQVDLQQAIPIAIQGVQLGALEPNVLKLILRQTLKDMGVPIDMVSPDDDPLTNKAFEVAAGMQPQSANLQMQQANQVPSLDGRSGSINSTGAMANPDGSSQQITGGTV